MSVEKTEKKSKKNLEKYVPPIEEMAEELSDAGLETYHNPNKIIRLSTWANTLSWIVLVIAVIIAFTQLYLNIEQVRQYNQVPPLAYLYYVGNSLLSLVVGVFYFVVLQAVSEIINILLDIHENTAPEAD